MFVTKCFWLSKKKNHGIYTDCTNTLKIYVDYFNLYYFDYTGIWTNLQTWLMLSCVFHGVGNMRTQRTALSLDGWSPTSHVVTRNQTWTTVRTTQRQIFTLSRPTKADKCKKVCSIFFSPFFIKGNNFCDFLFDKDLP